MCNCKGWDVSYGPDEVTVVPHFCRTYGDCGHVENTMEEAARHVAEYYEDIARQWRDGSHPDLQHYRRQE